MKTLHLFFFMLMVGIFISACANRVIPTGGEKDTEPPVLLSSVPENNTTNFSSKTIILTFDEYIQLKDIGSQLVVSPPIRPAPLIEIRKKSVIIEPGDSLAPNTTYTINFGNALADNNEGNLLPGFRYVFSTGTYIDSLMVQGTIVDALTNEPQEATMAMLYNASEGDTTFLNRPPDYFSRTDKNGKFKIQNIRPGSYRIFALSEKNNNYIFDSPDEKIGFVAEKFDLTDSSEFEVRVYKQSSLKQSVKSSIIREPGVLVTAFARPVKNVTYEIQGKGFDKIIPEFSSMGDTVSLYSFPPVTDTLSVIWFENSVPFDTVKYQKQRSQSVLPGQQKKTTGYSFYPQKNAVLNPETTPAISWWAPIDSSNFSKIIFKKDSVDFPVQISFSDSLKSIMKMDGEWKEGSYTALLLPGAVTDVYGFSNDSISSSFTIPAEKTKGSISFKFMMLQPGAHLLQLVNEKHELIRQRSFEEKSTGVFEMVDPGTYRLRVITDVNSNNRWDGGDFINGLLPEEVRYYKEPIVVRSNWEVEIEWVK